MVLRTSRLKERNIYQFKLTARNIYSNQDLLPSSSDTVTIEIIESAPVIVVEGGYDHALRPQGMLVLNATNSFDPDREKDNKNQLNFEWECVDRRKF